jgi:hypothetical protein
MMSPLIPLTDHRHLRQSLDRLQRDATKKRFRAFGLQLYPAVSKRFAAGTGLICIADIPCFQHGYAVDHMNCLVAQNVEFKRIPAA